MTSWIPIEERKPAKFGRYLTGQVCGPELTAWYLPKYDTWIDDRGTDRMVYNHARRAETND